MLVPHLADDPVRKAELAVRARADAEVIAELPVVQIVLAALAGLGVCRHLVVLVACRRQPRVNPVLHCKRRVVIRQRGRVLGEVRVRLQRQVVQRHVVRIERQRGLHVGLALGKRLARQGKHQVEVDVVEMGAGDVDGGARFGGAVDAAQRLQVGVVETLDADRQAVHTAGAIAAEAFGLEGAGIGFHRDLGVGINGQQHADVREQAIQPLR